AIRVDREQQTVSVSGHGLEFSRAHVRSLTFTLSESVGTNTFTSSDVAVSSGTLSGFGAVNGTTYTANYTAAANSTTSATINVAGVGRAAGRERKESPGGAAEVQRKGEGA